MECHGLDTENQVFFYEQDYYVLSNFSAFAVVTKHGDFPTSEHAYHYEKFLTKLLDHELPGGTRFKLLDMVRNARSAHDAFKIAEQFKSYRREDWDAVKVGIMERILRHKVEQHEYVKRKLIATGKRQLIENSWRDNFWGWGPNRDGRNMLGKIWMKIRDEIKDDNNSL